MIDTSRLLPTLQLTGLAHKNQPLYQLLNQLIGIETKIAAIINATGGIGPVGPVGADGKQGIPGNLLTLEEDIINFPIIKPTFWQSCSLGIYYAGGNVGIGNINPFDTLQVTKSDAGLSLISTGLGSEPKGLQILNSVSSLVYEFNLINSDGSNPQTYWQMNPITGTFDANVGAVTGFGITVNGGGALKWYKSNATVGHKRHQIQPDANNLNFQRATDDDSASETYLSIIRSVDGSSTLWIAIKATTSLAIGTLDPVTDIGTGFNLAVIGSSQFQVNTTSSPKFRMNPIDGVGMRFVLSRAGSPTNNEWLRIADLNSNDFVYFDGHTKRVGILQATPTAYLHLGAGTASANTAPIKIDSGTLLTTPEAGAIEFLTDAYYGTITTGTARKTFAFREDIAVTQGSGKSDAQTAAVATVAAFTVGSSNALFLVGANINVTVATLHNFTCTVSYTDETNTARVLTLSFSQLTGAFVTAITNATGAGAYEGIPLTIRCKASTTITIATTGTFTTVTYNVSGFINQVALT